MKPRLINCQELITFDEDARSLSVPRIRRNALVPDTIFLDLARRCFRQLPYDPYVARHHEVGHAWTQIFDQFRRIYDLAIYRRNRNENFILAVLAWYCHGGRLAYGGVTTDFNLH